MTTAKHTAEPWIVLQFNNSRGQPQPPRICKEGVGGFIAQTGFHGGIANNGREANAARIAACVNACAGMEDPAAALAEARGALKEAIFRMGGNRDTNYMDCMQTALRALGG